MSVLDKLIIRGIRSFGPGEDEKVKFSTPLTLFLGQNGCGKTTIIECIKYALTSDLPSGTDSGQGFVNDPKLSSKSATKACVKLRFKDSRGDYITVGKFIEVSVLAGGKLKFKSLNPSIRREDTQGNYEDVAGRCVDIDLYCSQKLNVSKAILNNVIFCHQENSAWPLEEAQKLKVKFDEIFGATEYNKCVERLRKLIKGKKLNMKVLNLELEQKRMAKKNTERLKEGLTAKEEQLEKIQDDIEEKDKAIQPLQERLDEINVLVDSISQLQQQLIGLKKSLEGITEHQTAIKKHLHEEYEGSDDELNHEITNFRDFQANIENQISAMEQKKKTLESTLGDVGKQLQRLQVSFGSLKEEENQHLKRIEEMNELLDKAKVKLNVVADTIESVTDMLPKLKTALKGEENNFNQHKKDYENEEQQLQKGIDAIRDKCAAAKESFSSKNKMITEAQRKKKEAAIKLKSLANSNAKIELVGKRVKEYEDSLKKKKAEFNEGQEHQELEELDNQITQKENLQNRLDREYKTLQQNYVAEQNIDREKILINEKKNEIDGIQHKHEQNFEALFGNNLPEEKIEHAIKVIQKREDEKVRSITKNISDYEKRVTSLESKIKHTTEQLQCYRDELRQNRTRIENVCAGRTFSDVLKQSYTKKEKLQKDKGTYRSAKTLFEEFINQFEVEKACCPVCETDFSGKRAVVSTIVKRLKSKIEELPNKLVQIESDLKKEEEFYNKLQQLKSVNENVEMLQEAKIPLVEEELQQAKEKLEETSLELASIKNDIEEPQNLVDRCRKVISDVALLDRLILDVKRSEAAIETMKGDLVHVVSNRTLDQTETELSKLKVDLSNLRRQHKAKREYIDETKDYIQRLNGKLQSETQKKIEMEKEVQERPLLEKQIEEYTTSVIDLEEEKSTLKDVISNLERDLDEAERNRNEAIRKNKKILEEKRMEFETRKRVIDDIQKLHNTVERYENGGSKTKLENVLKTLDETKEKLSSLENAKKVLNEKITEKKAELASQESKLRALQDNRELRESRVKSKELDAKIKDLNRQIGNHNCQSIIEERRRLMAKIDQKHNEKSVKTGERNAVQKTINEYKMELTKKEHKEVLTDFKKKFYEVRVEQLATQDLETYTMALEKSILKFHKERMVQINMTIRELWRSIYKGNDIDHIEIQTVDDIGSGKKRSYDYKVVQVKKGVELEMRGRCSAGQRVLACLVIRMALAETFSANCGILALDEPTTNLDRDNIMSLSDALSKIIRFREKQRSFQLLIITHDEDFLQTLTRDQSVTHYFRVQRNADGFSEIKKEML